MFVLTSKNSISKKVEIENFIYPFLHTSSEQISKKVEMVMS